MLNDHQNNFSYIVQSSMFLLKSCLETGQVISSSFEDNAIITGVSDTIIVRQKNGSHLSTPFLICFGPYHPTHKDGAVAVSINGEAPSGVTFILDHKGYIQPQHLSNRQIKQFNLKFGMNKAVFQLGKCKLSAEIYLYTDNEKVIVSDVDGTVTKNDIGGHANNFIGRNYLHQGYTDLCRKADQNGYKIVWLTMRALPLYNYSKDYLRQTVGVDGPILMQPEQFGRALSKQLRKKTGNIKANLMNMVRELFPVNPFQAGLGNREGDAIAYLHAGIPLDRIFIIDTKSRVQQMSSGNYFISYSEMCDKSQEYFPVYSAPKIGYT